MARIITRFLIILVGVNLQQMILASDNHSITTSMDFLSLRNQQKWQDLAYSNDITSSGVNFQDQLLLKTVREILQGPLEGNSITLLIDEGDIEGNRRLHFLIKKLETPIILVTTEVEANLKEEGLLLPTYQQIQNTTMEESVVDTEVINNISQENITTPEVTSPTKASKLSNGILLCIVNEESDKSLLRSPLSLSFSGLIIIHMNSECILHALLQMPLALRTKSLVLLCPSLEKEESQDIQHYGFKLYSIRPYEKESKIVHMGIWSPSAFPTWDDLFIDRFPSFCGLTLHVASDKTDMPFLSFDTELGFDGISKRLMDTLGIWMNFNYTLTQRAKDERWGSKEDEAWVGMLGEVWRGEKNLTINSFTLTRERVQGFDFSFPYYRAGFGFIAMLPPPLPRWMNLTYSFTLSVWLATVGTLIFIALAFYLLSRGRSYDISTVKSFLIMTKGLLKQSVSMIPESWTLRLFLAFWWLGSYIIVVYYTCNLIAILTVPLYPPKLQTVQQLADSDYRLCMLDYGEYVPGALISSQDASLSALGKKLELVPWDDQEWNGDENCIALVLGGDYVHIDFFSYIQNLYNLLGHHDRIYHIREQIYESSLAFFFTKGTPWVYKFDWGIQQLVEAHLIGKWHSDILRRQGGITMEEFNKASDKPLSLAHLQGPFMIFTIGIGVSNIVFLVEFLGLRSKVH